MSRRDRGPPNTEGMISLKVDNLTYRTTPEMLRRVFEKYGDVGDVYIPRDPYTQESRGFAFVRYYDDRDADDAIDALNGTLLDGRELRVQLAKHARPPMTSSYSRRSGPSSSRRSGRRYSIFIVCTAGIILANSWSGTIGFNGGVGSYGVTCTYSFTFESRLGRYSSFHTLIKISNQKLVDISVG
jgi:splicing factor, arginine/serine-rich 2